MHVSVTYRNSIQIIFFKCKESQGRARVHKFIILIECSRSNSILNAEVAEVYNCQCLCLIHDESPGTLNCKQYYYCCTDLIPFATVTRNNQTATLFEYSI